MIELLMALSLSAQEISISGETTLVDCRKAGSTIEQRGCWALFLGREDARLETYLREAIRRNESGHSSEPSRTDVAPYLNASQGAFQAYRDIACAAVYESYGLGNGASVGAMECKIQLAHDRTRMIWRDYLKNSEGDRELPEPINLAWEDEYPDTALPDYRE